MQVKYTLHIIGLVMIAVVTCAVNYYSKPWKTGVSYEFAEKRLAEVLADTTHRPWNNSRQHIVLIKTEEDVVAVAEPILFGIYGKQKILKERPYGVYKFGDYWYVSGSLQRWYDFGGGFEIILDSRDARVLSITHYK